MGSFDDMAEQVSVAVTAPEQAQGPGLPEPPAIPRPGVYAVLKYTADRGFWWELTADPMVRMYWRYKEAGEWPDFERQVLGVTS